MDEDRVPRSDASDDDAAWLAALRGRPVGGSPSPAEQEGILIREAMLKWPPAVDALAIPDPKRIERLLERARAEGLLDEPPAAAVDGAVPPDRSGPRADAPPGWWARVKAGGFGRARTSLAVATVLVVATTVWLARPGPPGVDDESVRAAPDVVVVLRVPDPEAARQELVDGLAAAGVVVTRYTRFGRLGVDADLPQPLPAGIVGVLQRQGLQPPADGVLRVEYEVS